MDASNVLVGGNNQVNEERPPPRVCPRCSSNNTKFRYYNNYRVSQPRYNCKNCRRFWTHGGALRNIPIGGNPRKTKRTRIDEPPASQVVSSVIQQVNHHQPFLNSQETNEFLGTFGGSSSSTVGNHFSYFPETQGDMVPPIRSIPPIDHFDLSDESFNQGYYGVGYNDLVSNPLMNQEIGGHVDNNYNSYLVNQENSNYPNPSFNNSMNMSYNASTSGSRYPGTDHMINNNNNNRDINNCVFTSSYIWR